MRESRWNVRGAVAIIALGLGCGVGAHAQPGSTVKQWGDVHPGVQGGVQLPVAISYAGDAVHKPFVFVFGGLDHDYGSRLMLTRYKSASAPPPDKSSWLWPAKKTATFYAPIAMAVQEYWDPNPTPGQAGVEVDVYALASCNTMGSLSGQ